MRNVKNIELKCVYALKYKKKSNIYCIFCYFFTEKLKTAKFANSEIGFSMIRFKTRNNTKSNVTVRTIVSGFFSDFFPILIHM